MYRIGQSRDIHRLEKNSRPFILGGIKIEFDLGPVSHSDGDVLFHAIAEALLGSCSLGDLGKLFPDNDEAYKDYNSELILKTCYQLVLEKGYKIVNIDTCIITEKPKLKGYIDDMRKNVARILNVDLDNVSIKAQTNEKCGEIGALSAIEATAIVLIKKD